MRNFKTIFLALVIVAFAASAMGADMGVSQGRDLDALWAAAQKNFDTATEDAVLLLESREVTLNGDGTKSTRVHTVVHITSSMGIRGYADLRIPWDTATSELEVEVLRTWMDERWWPDAERISDTAVVHTLPHALRTAHDYTTMRETMLLHDGVELPCIMETVYTITEKMAFDHTDGMMVLPQRDPAVRVELRVSVPTGVEVEHEAMNGVPAPVVDNSDGHLVMTWAMDDVAPLKMPITSAPERYEPAVVWSTWPSWEAVRASWRESLEPAMVLAEGLADSLAVLDADSRLLRLRNIVWQEWVDRNIRVVHYGSSHWYGRARPAGRTFATGYGHALDRAALYASLDHGRESPVPVFFVGPLGEQVAPSVPRLGGLGDLMVGDFGATLYDPEHGRLVDLASLAGRPAYLYRDEAFVFPDLKKPENDWHLDLRLQPGEDGSWEGAGSVSGQGVFSDYSSLADGTGAGFDHCGALLGAALAGAELDQANAALMSAKLHSFSLAFTLPMSEEDEHGMKRLQIGSARGGILSRLPGDVHLQDVSRASPVITESMVQVMTVRIKGATVTGPEELMIENEAGSFKLTVEQDHGWTVIKRELELSKERYDAADWPALRALLLEEQDPRHGTIIFE